ncbi:POL2 [Hepatospora eriocheir]|uniref:POL2 n=1 Tax=Hepatospora eriocheir TaxID=1081669 RepID=A0A1X0Q9P2_9MICR|nr:POL2 [Hepatospora eriocheir]
MKTIELKAEDILATMISGEVVQTEHNKELWESEDERLNQIIEEYDKKIRKYYKNQEKLIPHHICIKENMPIVNKRQYRMNIEKQIEVKRQCEEMLLKGIIEESNSPWNSPIILVPKKDNKWRICVDFRLLNNITKEESCPPPTTQECFDVLGVSNYFSTLDLEAGYHQIPMDEQSKHMTAFTTVTGKYHYKKMPFGLRNAPSHFQNIMYVVLQKFIPNKCIAYMDDIIVFSKGKEEHYNILKEILNQLAEYGLKINLDKCQFIKKEIEFLGFKIMEKKLFPAESKNEKLQNILKSKNKKELRSALGFLSYYRQFIRNFASKTKQLNK